jgi:Skp family chaperone for outer membrane proteins
MWDQIIAWGVFAFVMLCFFGVVSAFASFVGGVMAIGNQDQPAQPSKTERELQQAQADLDECKRILARMDAREFSAHQKIIRQQERLRRKMDSDPFYQQRQQQEVQQQQQRFQELLNERSQPSAPGNSHRG